MTDILAYAYTQPWVQPPPIWDAWYLLIVPLCLGVAIVHRSTKVTRLRDLWASAGMYTLKLLGGMVALAAAISLLAWWIR